MGYIGRLESGKGVDLLLGAAARLREPGWELRVAGTGTPEYELAAKAAAVGLPISFVGEVSAEQFLPDLDLLVVPSLRHDPSPTVVLEAFAFGVPVVGARRGGIPEMIEDGRTGFLFEPDGPATLAARLQQLITERKSLDSMRAACVEQAGEYSIRQCAQRYEGEYVAALTSTD
jgi:glycosyltransferase involved in cell wall biosynthesis